MLFLVLKKYMTMRSFNILSQIPKSILKLIKNWKNRKKYKPHDLIFTRIQLVKISI